MSVAAVVVAAGQGQRYGGPKQFAVLNHDTVTAHSVRAARSVAERVVLVVPANYQGNGEGADVVVIGGATRAASVRAGLGECADADVIVVHDAARPMATPLLFAAVVDAVRAGADGAIPGLPIMDTVKRVRRDGPESVVEETEERDELVTVQTPQAFARDVLIRAHADGGNATDDAALVEALGGRVVVVPGELDNVKITVPGDLARASSIELRR
jgi:2-C-methyl-D-erythritol 4-phosphate cytidylyltransferase